MVTTATIGMAIGAALGCRCRVYALVPAHLLVAVVAGVVVMLHLSTVGSTTVSVVVWSVACDAGYGGAALLAGRRRTSVAVRAR